MPLLISELKIWVSNSSGFKKGGRSHRLANHLVDQTFRVGDLRVPVHDFLQVQLGQMRGGYKPRAPHPMNTQLLHLPCRPSQDIARELRRGGGE